MSSLLYFSELKRLIKPIKLVSLFRYTTKVSGSGDQALDSQFTRNIIIHQTFEVVSLHLLGLKHFNLFLYIHF